MRATELRIGNYLLDEEGDQIQIEEVSPFLHGCKYRWDWCKTFKPIPLTEEWLKKFGFSLFGEAATDSKSPEDWYWVTGKCNFPSIGNLSWVAYLGNINVRCKYVHQLQNLYFALTGEEL